MSIRTSSLATEVDDPEDIRISMHSFFRLHQVRDVHVYLSVHIVVLIRFFIG